MSDTLKERLEKIDELLSELAVESERGMLIVVEGKKDLRALRFLGVKGPVMTAKTGGKSFDQALCEVEKTGAKQAILLFDFDRRGKEATKYFKRNLEQLKISPNLSFWRTLSGLSRKEIQCIEGLPSLMESLKKKAANL